MTEMPNSLTAWTLWHRDRFDHGPASQEAKGVGISAGLFELWDHTLSEAILDTGNAGFSDFCLTWGGGSNKERVDIFLNPFDNHALGKLRQWVYPPPEKNGEPLIDKHNTDVAGRHRDTILLRKIAELHLELLLKSPRWTDKGINFAAESQQLLALVAKIESPRDL